MSSIQEMIEMQNRLAKMVSPVANLWNNPAIDYLRQNASEINRVNQCAQQITASVQPIVGKYVLNSAWKERQRIVSSMTAGLEMFRTPEYIDTIQSVVSSLGNMTETLKLFSGIIKNFNISQEIIDSSFIDYAKNMSQSMVSAEYELLRQNDNIKNATRLLYEDFLNNIDLEENNFTELTNRICEEMSNDSEEEVDLQSQEGFRNDTEIREFPNKDAGIIGELKDEQAIVTGDEPYYYKIKFTGEDGKEHEGFVSKRSVILIEDSDEESDME